MISGKRADTIPLGSLKQKNTGKVQFNAVREEIFALLNKGYSRRALHAVLHEKRLFTGSYRRFCEYVQGIENRENGKKKPEPAHAALGKAAPPVSTPRPGTVTPAAPASPAPTAIPPTATPAPRQEKPAVVGFVHSTPNHKDLF